MGNVEWDINFDAALDLSIAIEKNAHFAHLKICLACILAALGCWSLGATNAQLFMFSGLLLILLETRHEILQYLRRSERASIYRTNPELFTRVQDELEKLKADKKFWQSLTP